MQIRKLTFAAIACAAVLASVLGAPARAEEVKAGDLVITEALTRATPKGAKKSGGYLTIENKGTAPDRLIGGSAARCRSPSTSRALARRGRLTAKKK